MIRKSKNWQRTLSLCAALALSGVGACSITHEGPQEGTETGNPPVIDVARVMLVIGAADVKITGGRGAVSPGGSALEIQSSLTGMIYRARAEADGSFTIAINPASPSDIFELRAADASGDTSQTSPVYVSRGSAAVSAQGLSCMQRDNLARAQVGAVAQAANTYCKADPDCRLQETSTVCTDGCNPIPVSMLGASEIDEAREAVANGVCKTFAADGCSVLALPCPGPRPTVLRCIANTCTTEAASPSNEPKTGCSEPFDTGTGDALIARYWYSAEAQACLPRTYGGIGGNANRYETRAACEAACKPSALSCVAPRVSVNVCLEGGPAGGCALRGMACALPCTAVDQCAGDAFGSWCAAGYCDATSPE